MDQLAKEIAKGLGVNHSPEFKTKAQLQEELREALSFGGLLESKIFRLNGLLEDCKNRVRLVSNTLGVTCEFLPNGQCQDLLKEIKNHMIENLALQIKIKEVLR